MPISFHHVRSALIEHMAPHLADRHAGAITRALSQIDQESAERMLRSTIADPRNPPAVPALVDLARMLLANQARLRHAATIEVRPAPLSFEVFGADGIAPSAMEQMASAMRLGPVRAGALMPDAHKGYALPIGGVIGVENALIPFAVGVDIGCRMHLTVFEEPSADLQALRSRLRESLLRGTFFGSDIRERPMSHDLLDDPRFRETERFLNCELKGRCAMQFGSSGSGNHFVEFGELEVTQAAPGLPAGRWLALLSHSGSRALGFRIANEFTRIAKRMTPLPEGLEDFAWLPLDTEEGRAYRTAMELAGDFSAANHQVIHDTVIGLTGLTGQFSVSNHHNFAWEEQVGDRTLFVHRKGATPAAPGVLGFIPGSMGAPGFLVRGLGNAGSLSSASHGAGRAMSRTHAERTITSAERDRQLAQAGVELLAGGLDEAPGAYKDIRSVMAAQSALVETLAEFHPRIVRMAGSTEKDPEEGN